MGNKGAYITLDSTLKPKFTSYAAVVSHALLSYPFLFFIFLMRQGEILIDDSVRYCRPNDMQCIRNMPLRIFDNLVPLQLENLLLMVIWAFQV